MILNHAKFCETPEGVAFQHSLVNLGVDDRLTADLQEKTGTFQHSLVNLGVDDPVACLAVS